MPYKVFIDDNFHYMDEDERIHHGEFLTADESVAAAKKIVDDELEHLRSSGVKADEIMSMFVQFGPDPFIVSDNEPISFSARDYAREKIAEWANDVRPLSEWFRVNFDETGVELNVEPPGREPWKSSIKWERVIRVCFKSGDLLSSDEIYIFTDERPESWLIPTEAFGGMELWYEIIERGLFDAETAIKAATGTNELFCCPET
jgi:hypothetical protein